MLLEEKLFIETMRLTREGINYLNYHQNRVDTTLQNHNLQPFNIVSLLRNLPSTLPAPVCRLRIVYGNITPQISITPYVPRKRNSVKIIADNQIDYSYKYENRTPINNILSQAGSDDIIIIKEDRVTDSSVANLVFENKDGFFTPTTFLLNGTTRQRLLDTHIIKKKDISLNDISSFSFVYFINALSPLLPCYRFPIKKLEYY